MFKGIVEDFGFFLGNDGVEIGDKEYCYVLKKMLCDWVELIGDGIDCDVLFGFEKLGYCNY